MMFKDFLNSRLPIKSQASFVEFGYGQVEPNHLSAQRNGQIYAQLPADPAINILEQGQFVKYDYAADAKADYFYHVGNTGVAKKIRTKRHYNSHVYCLDKVSQMLSAKYGDKYDFYIESRIVSFLGTFKDTWQPYFDLLRMPWMKKRYGFKMRMWLYLATLKKDRRLIFRKYRKYSKRKNAIWNERMAEERKKQLRIVDW